MPGSGPQSVGGGGGGRGQSSIQSLDGPSCMTVPYGSRQHSGWSRQPQTVTLRAQGLPRQPSSEITDRTNTIPGPTRMPGGWRSAVGGMRSAGRRGGGFQLSWGATVTFYDRDNGDDVLTTRVTGLVPIEVALPAGNYDVMIGFSGVGSPPTANTNLAVQVCRQ